MERSTNELLCLSGFEGAACVFSSDLSDAEEWVLLLVHLPRYLEALKRLALLLLAALLENRTQKLICG